MTETARLSRFAFALHSIAIDEGKEKEYLEALRSIDSHFLKHPEDLEFLSSYSVPKDTIRKVIDESFASPALANLTSFLKVVSDKHAFPYFHDICQLYASLANASMGVREGIVYSASTLTSKEIKSIEQSLSKRLGVVVELEQRYDPSLIGGVKVAVDGKLFDGSLKNKIESLRKSLINGGNNNENRCR